MTPAVLAVAVTIITLALVITRPRGLNEGLAAIAGGVAVLLIGLVGPIEAARVEASHWNVFLFFLGMMSIATLADTSGVFDLLAASMARLAQGRIDVLYCAVFALGAIISLFFANDSAALVLTPIVYALVLRLSIDPLPFVFATTFIADTASVGLPVSNPLNVILADSFHLNLGSYLGHLWLPAALVIVVNVAVFYVWFRRSLRGSFHVPVAPEPEVGLASTGVLLGLLSLAYLVASAVQFPLGIVAVVGAAVMALNLLRLGRLEPLRLARETSWPIFGFLGGMLLVVRAVSDAGVTASLGRALVHAGSGGALNAIAVTTAGTAVGSNLINNLPMALVMVSTIHPLHLSTGLRIDMVYGTLLGCDLGPNFTHLGSLATFIWLFFLRRKGLDVSTWDYFKLGIVTTPLMLLAAIIGLYLTTS
jgi:arsenical pump membrane protein